MWPFKNSEVVEQVEEKIEPEKPSAHYERCLIRVETATKVESTSNIKCPSSLRTNCGLSVSSYGANFKGARIELSQAELSRLNSKIWVKYSELLELERESILAEL